jgi:hypothetical protein
LFRASFEGRYRIAPIGEHEFLLLGTDTRLSFKGVTDKLAVSATISSSPRDVHARLDEYEHLPLDDLVGGEIEAALAFYPEDSGAWDSLGQLHAARFETESAAEAYRT